MYDIYIYIHIYNINIYKTQDGNLLIISYIDTTCLTAFEYAEL